MPPGLRSSIAFEDMETRDIYRSLKKLGFEGFDLKKEYLYFCSIHPFTAGLLLSKMLQYRGSRVERS